MQLLTAIPVLPVTSVEAALAFYEGKLGFTRAVVQGDTAHVGRDGVFLQLCLAQGAARPDVPGCRIVTRDIEGLYAEYRKQRVIAPQGELELKPWGLREFTAVDPFGNHLVFAETRL
jgi:catechol 2,3-dioxygenase-like lactoylglutathione lyase family enzyme